MEKIYGFTETLEPEAKEETFSPWETEAKVKMVKEQGDINVACFVLLTDSKELKKPEGSYNIKIFGSKMFEYVSRACPTPAICLEYNEGENIISKIRPYIKDTDYSLVLYSDTPLITRSNIINILNFAKNKGLNVCKLTRGFVFKNEYIRRVDEIYAPNTYYFEEEDFMMATTFKQLYIVEQTLKNRIITYHMNNGVCFLDPDSTYIDANVSIGEGTIIGPYAFIGGSTTIGENVTIGERTTLKNAKVYSRATVDGAYLDGAIVMREAVVKNGCSLLSPVAIKNGAVVMENCNLSSVVVGENSVINRGCVIMFASIGDNARLGNLVMCYGTKEKSVVVDNGVTLEDYAFLPEGKHVKKEDL